MRIFFFVVVALSLGCAHQMKIESSPPGAFVVEDGKVIGTTPLTLDETTGPVSWRTLEVQSDAGAERFAVVKDGWAPDPILAGVLGGVGAFVGGIGLSTGGTLLYTLGLVTGFGGNTPLAITAVLGGFGLILVGSLAAGIAPMVPLLATAYFGRKGPDVVKVDLASGQISSSPPQMVDPLIGRTLIAAPSAKQDVQHHGEQDAGAEDGRR